MSKVHSSKCMHAITFLLHMCEYTLQKKIYPCVKGYCTPYPKLACFVLYLKIINTFENKHMYLTVNCSRNLKMVLKLGQMVVKLWIKAVKLLFGSITHDPLGLPKFYAILEFLGQFFKKKLIILIQSTKHAKLMVGDAVPP